MAKKKNNVKQAVRQAGAIITNKEMNKIVKAAGGDTQKAVNRIASVQKNAKSAGKQAPSVAAGAANMLIKQAQSKQATTGTPSFGSSKLGKTLQGMVGTPGSAGYMRQGQTVGAQPAVPAQLMMGGTMIRPGGRTAVIPQGVPAAQPTAAAAPEPATEAAPAPTPTSPYEDAILSILAGMQEQSMANAEAFQGLIAESIMSAEKQSTQMMDFFNNQLMQEQDMYNMQIQQANAQALADEEAARAFMINQGRAMSPANLQIGAAYGMPQLAGTQGFKADYRTPSVTPTPTAFTAPTLAATAATAPLMTTQPTVLNV